MSTSSIGNTTTTQSTGTSTTSTSTSNTTSTDLKNEFLNLLVTQLKNQDPLSPMDNTEFVAQMAQFSSLEQLTNLNTSLSQISALLQNNTNDYLQTATRLMGKEVLLTDPDSGDTYQGTVEGFQIVDNQVYLTFQNSGNLLPLSWVSGASLATKVSSDG